MEKILISACFLGKPVRYDGKANTLSNNIVKRWQKQDRLVAICPEVTAGLPIPRAPAEIHPLAVESPIEHQQQVITKAGTDVSQAFFSGAAQALSLAQQHNIRFALMKESSPSCGSSEVYDGSFPKTKIAGAGITANLLRANGIEVFSEHNLAELVNKISDEES